VELFESMKTVKMVDNVVLLAIVFDSSDGFFFKGYFPISRVAFRFGFRSYGDGSWRENESTYGSDTVFLRVTRSGKFRLGPDAIGRKSSHDNFPRKRE
jgi:hypothetical protein